MAPIAANQQTPDMELEPCFDIGSQTITLNYGIVIVCLLLVFYALALWDRWITLKLYERQRLQGHRLNVNYGATQSSIAITRTPPELDKQCSFEDNPIPTSNGFLAPPRLVDQRYIGAYCPKSQTRGPL
ncbi:uncharacterized protein EV420DRAFT_1641331 [Desarmillaria tabescens]|uniref:Uncharacterized protein n=1 Tax=Armillaria tabescens TaxID=1929756 RepID=A0AA39KHE0_ARMTA|nr:uncharacterized protein EV420DRAFT_1641331 [Desarmillaria tabescens]KAK0459986.1 hypothetical protein EV420DRAFT_1641331 [Desarmillaria tabescens]